MCGVDIIEIDRVRQSIEETGDAFRNRVYTSNEIEYCEGRKAARYQSYAVRFAAKEAVSKALGTGISKGIGLKDIEILNDEHGKPYVVLRKKAEEIFCGLGGKGIDLSLSHCKEYAIAYVIIET